MKGIIIAGTHSGVGKTTVALGLMNAFKNKGINVQPFKVGPDYIDTGFHRLICNRPSYNLDTWMMGNEGVRRTFCNNLEGVDIAIIEGVMGLFDGKDGSNREGSTSHVAMVLGIPVILVVDVRSMAQSAGALVYGYENFEHGLKVAGIIFNRVGSKRHYNILKEVVERRCKAKVLGFIPNNRDIIISERYLGLVTSEEIIKQESEVTGLFKRLSSLVETNVDLNALLSLTQTDSLLSSTHPPPLQANYSEFPTKIAVAMDESFSFYYQENMDILKEIGGNLVPFSPLRTKKLPDDIGGIYFGGGYPELHAETLNSNISLKSQIKELAEEGLPIYAECGGLIYLGKTLQDLEGKTYEMVNLFPWVSKMLSNRKTLGYREVKIVEESPFLKKGQSVRGHEYHYSEIEMLETRGKRQETRDIKSIYSVTNSQQTAIREGYLYKNVLASYIHLHFASNRNFAKGFVSLCRNYKSNRRKICPFASGKEEPRWKMQRL